MFVKIKSWNFQQLFDLGFRETLQNFSSFRQTFRPHSSVWNKSRSNELKFCKVPLWFNLPNYLPLLSVLDTKGVNAKQIYLFELSLGKYLQISWWLSFPSIPELFAICFCNLRAMQWVQGIFWLYLKMHVYLYKISELRLADRVIKFDLLYPLGPPLVPLKTLLEISVYRKDNKLAMSSVFAKLLLQHSVLEYIWIKGSYPDQILPQHESLYPIGLKSYILGTFLLRKMSLNVITVKLGLKNLWCGF